MRIESEVLCIVISVIFAAIGLFTYAISSQVYAPVWIMSFIALLAANIIDVVNRMYFDCPKLEELEDIIHKEEAL